MSNVTPMPEIITIDQILNHLTAYYDDECHSVRSALAQAIQDMASKAGRFQRSATVTLTINIKPDKKNELLFSASVGNKEPKAEGMPMPFYTDEAGRLYAEDPRQLRLPVASRRIGEPDFA